MNQTRTMVSLFKQGGQHHPQTQQRQPSPPSSPATKKMLHNNVMDSLDSPTSVTQFESWEEDPPKISVSPSGGNRITMSPVLKARVAAFEGRPKRANKAALSRTPLRNDWCQKDMIRQVQTFPTDVYLFVPPNKQPEITKPQQPPLQESLRQLEPVEPEPPQPPQDEDYFWLDPDAVSVCSSVTTPSHFSESHPTVSLILKPSGTRQNGPAAAHTGGKSVTINPCNISYKIFDRKTAASNVRGVKEDTVVDLGIEVEDDSHPDAVVEPTFTSGRIDRVAGPPTLPPLFDAGGPVLSSPPQRGDEYEPELSFLFGDESNPNNKKTTTTKKKKKKKIALTKHAHKATSRRRQSEQPKIICNDEPVTRRSPRRSFITLASCARSPSPRPRRIRSLSPLQIIADQQERQRVNYLQDEAAALIQAGARRYLDRVWKTGVDKLRCCLLTTYEKRCQEVHDIEAWKHQEMAKIRREVLSDDIEWQIRLRKLKSQTSDSRTTIEELRRENAELRKEQRELQQGYDELQSNRIESMITSTLTCGMKCSAVSSVVELSNQVLGNMEEDYRSCIARAEKMRDEMDRLYQVEKGMNAILKNAISQLGTQVRGRRIRS